MIPWQRLGTAPIPGGNGELRLMQRGSEFSIMLGINELMNSRVSGSEEALATLAVAKLGERPAPRVLIGGLGMGFTLRAALGALPPDAVVTVAELVPAIVDWARGPMTPIFGGSLDDPRVDLKEADVGSLIAGQQNAYDAILLDVDNGPDGLTLAENDSLYDLPGLRTARAALRPGGVLAVWSTAPDARFATRIWKAGFAVEELRVRTGRSKRGPRHVIWLGVSSR